MSKMNNWLELLRHPAGVYDAAIAASGKAAAAGGATGLLGFILSSPGIGLLGVVVAFSGVIVGVYFKWRRDQREQREHELRIADLQAVIDDKKS